MSIFDRFKPSNLVKLTRRPRGPVDRAEPTPSHVPNHTILAYVNELWSGTPKNAAFEAKSLSKMGFTSLHLAELLFQVAKAEGIPSKRVTHFLSVGILGGGDRKLALLFERIEILANAGLSEAERMTLLGTGAIGDPSEISPINNGLDCVRVAVGLCACVKGLKDLTDHHAIEATHGSVKVDDGWPSVD